MKTIINVTDDYRITLIKNINDLMSKGLLLFANHYSNQEIYTFVQNNVKGTIYFKNEYLKAFEVSNMVFKF